nr:SNF2 domain-containing protein CLASSY 4-like [Ipomoea batatas]GME12419.1 SNF2 domain-containing protein CLASSY 4-like [Ipomoea batatas]GME15119.1 SNF2 domain-containing protein CLASSY 4-like [Ipomoea batatas]
MGRPRTRNQWGEFFEKLNEEKKLKRNQFSGLENNDSDVDEVIVVEKERKRHRRSSETKKGSSSDIEFVEDFVKGEREKEKEKEKGKEKEKDKRKCLDLVESDSSDDVAFIGETFPVYTNKNDMVKVISLDSDTDEKEREKEKGKDTGTSSQSLPVAIYKLFALFILPLPQITSAEAGKKTSELGPSAGVKTSFVFELVKLCSAHGERVIVFSRLVEPMLLIEQQLMHRLKWSENEEILYMDGKIDAKY